MTNGSPTPTRYQGTCENGHEIKTICWEIGTREGKWIRCSTCAAMADADERDAYGFAREAKDVEDWYRTGVFEGEVFSNG